MKKMETKEISLGRKILELIPVVGIPFVLERTKYTKFEKEHKIITRSKHLYTSLNMIGCMLYIGFGLSTKMWTPKQYKEFKQEQKLKQQHIQSIETKFQNSKNYYLNPNSTKLDSFNFYNKYFSKAIVFDESMLTIEDKDKGSREAFRDRHIPKSIDTSLID